MLKLVAPVIILAQKEAYRLIRFATFLLELGVTEGFQLKRFAERGRGVGVKMSQIIMVRGEGEDLLKLLLNLS